MTKKSGILHELMGRASRACYCIWADKVPSNFFPSFNSHSFPVHYLSASWAYQSIGTD